MTKKSFRFFGLLGMALAFFILIAPGAYTQRQTSTYFHGRKLILEIADTPENRTRGLMFRKTLPANHGMLFVFPNDEVRYFWMKNTLIPLDIAFLDKSGTILTIKTMKPENSELVSSEKPSRYALEVNAGFFRKVHAHPGEKIKLLLN